MGVFFLVPRSSWNARPTTLNPSPLVSDHVVVLKPIVKQVDRDKNINMGRLSKGAGLTEVRNIDYSGYVRRTYVSTADEDTLNSDVSRAIPTRHGHVGNLLDVSLKFHLLLCTRSVFGLGVETEQRIET